MARRRDYPSPRTSSHHDGRPSWGASRGSRSSSDYGSSSSKYSSSYSSKPTSAPSSNRYSSESRYVKDKPDRRSQITYGDTLYKMRKSIAYRHDERRRSPERKKLPLPASSSSRNEKYRPPPPPPSRKPSTSHQPYERSSSGSRYSRERHPLPPPPPPPSSRPPSRRVEESLSRARQRSTRRAPHRGASSRLAPRLPVSRSARGAPLRERQNGKRLLERSYAIRKKAIVRPSDSRRLRLAKLRSNLPRRNAVRRRPREREAPPPSKREEPRAKRSPPPVKEKEVKPEKKREEPPKSEDESPTDKKKSYINLHCPHCDFKAITFRRYELHLVSRRHLVAMKQVAQKQKSTLSEMRLAQRNAQNDLEKNGEDLGKKTNFCPLCKLNYKQKKAVHQASEAHRKMKKFLMPQCKICNVSFKSPMTYESHSCSIRHLKRKERVENASESEPSSDEEEVDLKNFTTIDSIEEGDASDADDAKESNINIGIEQIQKIEIYYCNLCKVDLPREADEKDVLAKHCKLRNHMKRYIKFKETQDIEKRAEKLQRAELTSKEGQSNQATDELVIKAEEKDIADVEKDLANILVKADVNSDDDGQLNGERYDRFKLSENNDEDGVKLEDVKKETKEKN